jgi:hypothetical protein
VVVCVGMLWLVSACDYAAAHLTRCSDVAVLFMLVKLSPATGTAEVSWPEGLPSASAPPPRSAVPGAERLEIDAAAGATSDSRLLNDPPDGMSGAPRPTAALLLGLLLGTVALP